MEDGLSGARPDVQDSPVSLLDIALPRDLGRGEMAPANDFRIGGVGFFQPSQMFFRNDEYVCRSLRVDVFEGENVRIFVNLLGGNPSPDHAVEKAIIASVGHGLPSFHRTEDAVKSAQAASPRYTGSIEADQED